MKKRFSMMTSRFALCLLLVLSMASCTPKETRAPYQPNPFVHENVTFTDIPFDLPEMESLRTLNHEFTKNMESAVSGNEQIELIIRYDKEMRQYSDAATIAKIRFHQNTSEENKATVQAFTKLFAEISQERCNAYRAIVQSEYHKELMAYFGNEVMDAFELEMQQHDPVQAELLVALSEQENKYVHLVSAYNGAVTMGFIDQANSILDQMVILRTQLAESAGYDSFPQYHYENWAISVSEIELFIGNVKQTVLPVYQKLTVNGDNFQDRCPAVQWIEPVTVTNEQQLYDLSIQAIRSSLEEVNPMIDYIQKNELLDVMPRTGKSINTAFMAVLPGKQIPFVFLDTPTPDKVFHEFGHALEAYRWPEIDVGERLAATPEAMELASTCMEVLATTQYETIYGDTAEYAKMAKIYSFAYTLLEAAMVCEFEFFLYDNPDASLAQRNKEYNRLVEEYGLTSTTWPSISHLYSSPLYTISYSLNTVSALDLLRILQDNPAQAKETYINYVDNNLQKNYIERLESAGFQNPLEIQTLEQLAQTLENVFFSEEYTHPERLELAG